MPRRLPISIVLGGCLLAAACAGDPPSLAEADTSRGLLAALSQFEVSPQGKALPKPGPARLEILIREGDRWRLEAIEDPDSNVFHKAMPFGSGDDEGILTLGGNAAAVKLWRRGEDGFRETTLWKADFGGKFSRMRDAEAVDLPDGTVGIAVATHDQGVVALLTREPSGGWAARELDRSPSTFVHEIETGDLDGDGTSEIYATPSEPNKLDGRPQRGVVVRYAPSGEPRRTVVADLGPRHAKEILVEDIDGDGKDELYVSVEAVAGGKLEIRRYVEGTDPSAGVVIATLEDRLCRFLTAGDVDGDGRLEIVAAAHKSGLWLLRPPSSGAARWVVQSIDRDSSGFEHAALFADLDGDGIDELYVASDDQGELRRYVTRGDRLVGEVIHRREVPDAVFTWNLMPVPRRLID